MSHNRFIYEQNNFVTFTDKNEAPKAFHKTMKFISNCKVAYDMTASPTIYYEIIEEFGATDQYDSKNMVLSFTLREERYTINPSQLEECLKLPVNNCENAINDAQVVDMLDTINYSGPTDNLGKLDKRHVRKEWSFLFDALIKVFFGKISNFNAITTIMQKIAYTITYDKYFNLAKLILNEMSIKLGKIEQRPASKMIYYARFVAQ